MLTIRQGGMQVLRLDTIRKTYKTGNFEQKALDGVSINFRSNEFAAILGPSGSGKTTMLNIIGGLDHYDSGDPVSYTHLDVYKRQQEINVGNLPARDGTRNVKKSINVTDEEIKDFQELSRRGVKLTGKQVPDNADDDLMELINKL